MDAVVPAPPCSSFRSKDNASFLRSESGSTPLEFALAVPVMPLFVTGSMIAMLGLLSFGNVVYATGLGARYASLHSSASDMPATRDMVSSEVKSRLWIGGAGAQITTVWTASNLPGSSVTVTTALTLPLAVPFENAHQLTITASAVRVVTR